jgi:hypothetical protein
MQIVSAFTFLTHFRRFSTSLKSSHELHEQSLFLSTRAWAGASQADYAMMLA